LTAAVLRAGPARVLAEDRIELLSAGVDIGSATTHLAISRLVLQKMGSRYVTVERSVVHESPVILTPYAGDTAIDGGTLGEFIAGQYRAAGLARDEIDTGALILTGVALLRDNARRIAELFAGEAGRFVAVSAGDSLEAVMSAYGSGAVARSGASGRRILNVDIGGGTTKLAVCQDGRVEATLALDVGARLIVDDAHGVVTRTEPAGRQIAATLGIPLRPGQPLAEADRAAIIGYMTDQLVAAAPLPSRPAGATAALSRGEPLPAEPADAVIFSGGVSEYVYGRQQQRFGDLGAAIAASVRDRLRAAGTEILEAGAGIRATVLGASQYTAQLSGSTIHVSAPDVLPLRNVPVVAPGFTLGEEPGEAEIADAVGAALRTFGLAGTDQVVALALRWAGSATFSRLNRLARGLCAGLDQAGHRLAPLVVVCDDDVGRLVGRHIVDELGSGRRVVSIDCVDLGDFDFIDIGQPIPGANVVPVVVKSLVFSGSPPGPQHPAGRR
jgi:ethanolamine utilization protein EutA (predicted chaperonin)